MVDVGTLLLFDGIKLIRMLIVKERLKYLLWVAVSALLTISCTSDLERFGSLENRVTEYYTHEKKSDYEKTYKMRTPSFRKTVPLDLYLSKMKENNSGWQLYDFTILGAEENNGKVNVIIKFSETAPIGIVPNELRGKISSPGASTIQTERTERSVWLWVENEWYCYDAVSRSRLSMNEPLVAE